MSYGSAILNIMMIFLKKLDRTYSDSALGKYFSRLALQLKTLFADSRIWNFVGKDDIFTVSWTDSFIYKVFDFVFNRPVKALRSLYLKNEGFFSSSIVFRLLYRISMRLDVVVAMFFVFAAITPHRFWDNIYSTAIVLFLTVIFLVRAMKDSDTGFKVKALDFALLLFILTIILAEVTSIFPKDSFRFLLFYLTCFMFIMLLVSTVKSSESLNRVLEILLVGIALTGLYGFYQRVVGVPFDQALTDINLNDGMPGRIFSTMDNCNDYAEILVLTLPFYIAVVLNAKNVLKKILYTGLALMPLISLFMTYSRSSWGGFAVAVFVFVFLTNRRLIPLLALTGILVFPFLPQSIYRRILTIFNSQDTSAAYRVIILDSFKPVLKEYWFTGLGLGTVPFNRFFQKFFEYTELNLTLNILELKNQVNEVDKFLFLPAIPPHTHNLPLQIWIETGIFGILTFAWFIIRIVKKCFKNIFDKTNSNINNILAAAISSIIGILVTGMVEYIWFYPRVMLFFWVDVAVILAGLGIIGKSGTHPARG